MNQASLNTSSIYYRLIALWVLCEAMLGGIIHGLKLPVTGLFVGGAAVIIISLIGFYVPAKGSILKATVIVCVFKMMLSPHSPPAAYFAVCFQGLLGELLFINKKLFRLSCLLLAVLAMVESALQRILVLLLLYGNTFWEAVDGFLSKLTDEKHITSYSYYFALVYVLLHLLAGILIGWMAGKLPHKIIQWKETVVRIQPSETMEESSAFITKKKKKLRIGLWIVGLLLLALFLQSSFSASPVLSTKAIVYLVLRITLIVLGWHLIVRPVASRVIQHWLMKKKAEKLVTIQKVNELLPSVSNVVKQSWNISSNKKGMKRFVYFCKLLTVNIVYAA
jgi:hypothetical protein